MKPRKRVAVADAVHSTSTARHSVVRSRSSSSARLFAASALALLVVGGVLLWRKALAEPKVDVVSRSVRLASGRTMPTLGHGMAGVRGERVCAMIRAALAATDTAGEILVDTAAQAAQWYRNEQAVGACLSEVERGDAAFVTTKLHPADHGVTRSVRSLRASLANLRRSSIDLFLFHYAICWGKIW